MDRKILIAGGSGLIGSRLSAMLRKQGAEVRILSRSPRLPGEFHWDPARQAVDAAALDGVGAVINLAGANITDKRWTPARRQYLISSRVQSVETLLNAMTSATTRPKVYIGGCAIGYYGNSGEQWMTETSAPVDRRFMTVCCEQWEAATDRVAAAGIRLVKLRIGIVLSRQGGALAEILKPLRFGLAPCFGDGRAWWSWIHLDDLCRMFIRAIEDEQVSGAYNAVAPVPLRSKELVRQVIAASGKMAVLVPAPAIALKLMLGEMSDVVLNSNRVSAEHIQQAGFQFQFPEAGPALRDILKTA